MAEVADRVVVELLAKTDSFEADIKRSAQTFAQAQGEIKKGSAAVEQVLENLKRKMAAALSAGNTGQANALAKQIAQIEGALGSVTVAAGKAGSALATIGSGGVGRAIADQERRIRLLGQVAGGASPAFIKLGHSAGSSRAAMQELGHVARAAGDQFAAGTPLTTIFATHLGQVAQAAGNSGTKLGALGAFLGGPWGIAITLATVVLAKLVFGHKSLGHEVDDLVKKMSEQAHQAGINDQANKIWGDTLEGLIDKIRRLREEQEKRLKVDTVEDQRALTQAKLDNRRLILELADLEKVKADLERKLRTASKPVPGAGTIAGQAAQGAQALQIQQLNAQIAKVQSKIDAAKAGIISSGKALLDQQIIVGKAQGEALTDQVAKAQLVAKAADAAITSIIRLKELGDHATPLEGATSSFKKAITDAASAGVAFEDTAREVDGLNAKLNTGKIGWREYVKQVSAASKALSDAAEAAKKTGKNTEESAVAQFKKGLGGAEGTGKNPNSSAFGVGQFLAQQEGQALTQWQTLVRRLFADQVKDLTVAQIDALRSKPNVANTVIDAAVEDYKKVLKAAGEKITAASLYAVHFFGAPTAKKFFAAKPDAPITSVISPHTAEINRIDTKATVSQVRALLAKRIGEASSHYAEGEAAIQQAQEELARETEQEEKRLRSYNKQAGALEGSILDAKQNLLVAAEAIAGLEIEKIQQAQAAYEEDQNYAVKTGQLRREEADHLIERNKVLAGLAIDAVHHREAVRKAQMRVVAAEQVLSRQTSSLDAQRAILEAQVGLAKTLKERHELQRRINDILFQEEKLHLLDKIAVARDVQANVNKAYTDEQIAAAVTAELDARNQLATLPARQDATNHNTDVQNASPLESYFGDIQKQADDMNSAFEKIASGGLETFTDALTNAIVNFTSLGDVGRAVLQQLTASLVKMAIQQVLLATIGKSFQTASTVATSIQMGAIATAAAPAAALVSLATSGSNAIPAQAALTSTTALATILGTPRAMGGRIRGPGGPTSDNILTPSSPGEFMIRTSAAKSIGYENLEAMNRTGRIAPANTPATAPTSNGGDMSGLRSIISDAVNAGIQAMPPVNLYASLDPVDMLQRALGSAAGEKALFASLGRNSGKVKATLG